MSKAAPRAAVVISPGDDGMQRSSFGALARSLLIGHIAFLTLVDLFATQAILPLLISLRLWRYARRDGTGR